MKVYEVTINGLVHTMQLSDEDAERYGDNAKVQTKQVAAPKNKSRAAAKKD